MEDNVNIIARLREHLASWEVSPKELYISDEVLGYGSTSVVYRGVFNGTDVAIKECNFDLDPERTDQGALAAFVRELEIWPTAMHPHILNFMAFSSVGLTLRICSEYCRGGSLFDLLHNCWHIPLSWTQRRKILIDIASAVEYLHTMHTPVMHRDLKSLNVLLVEPILDDQKIPETKLADFGFARMRPESEGSEVNTWPGTLTNGAGTPHWMAPEVSEEGYRYHEKVDVFSFSIIMYEVVCRHMSFEELDAEGAREEIMRGRRPSLGDDMVPPDTPRALVDLLVTCWAQSPEDRPSISDVRAQLEAIPWP